MWLQVYFQQNHLLLDNFEKIRESKKLNNSSNLGREHLLWKIKKVLKTQNFYGNYINFYLSII